MLQIGLVREYDASAENSLERPHYGEMIYLIWLSSHYLIVTIFYVFV